MHNLRTQGAQPEHLGRRNLCSFEGLDDARDPLRRDWGKNHQGFSGVCLIGTACA